MSVWLCIPSKRPPEECDPILQKWHERGYRIALWRDWNDARRWPQAPGVAFVRTAEKYPGYAIAVNSLVRQILEMDPAAEWVVTGGDDVEPDANHTAEEIARTTGWHFFEQYWCEAELHSSHYGADERKALETFGVMQPTGDRWGDHPALHAGDLKGAYIDRVCGSPWMGREFCRRMYQGNGPLFSGYFHMFEDAELQAVAQRLGVLWQRPDLIHYHRHWMRACHGDPSKMPEFLRKVSGPQHWAEAEALFLNRQRESFPGYEPIP
jgi:hypothetical protein